jgi:hypothetical protein
VALSVIQISAGRRRRAYCRNAAPRGSVNVLNLPDDGPAARAFRALGGRVAVRQREMSLRL